MGDEVTDDALQHQSGECACLDVVANGVALDADDLAGDARWPRFAPEATAAGVRIILAFTLPAKAPGALNPRWAGES